MKVNIDVPEWANYMAQDSSGYWYFYHDKPDCYKDFWNARDYYSQTRAVAYRDVPPEDHELTLFKLERNG